jgi:Leucine-rich repeat (LRR) protein
MKLTEEDFNYIFDLPDVKEHVTILQINNFWGLTKIPENLFNLTKLIGLQITYCNIKNLPESIGKLTNLRELYLKNCNLHDLPASLATLPHLRLLYIQNAILLEKQPPKFENKIQTPKFENKIQPPKFENKIQPSKENIDILFAIFNNRNKPIIRIDTDFGGENLVNDRVYKTGTKKDEPFRQNMLLQSNFDNLYKNLSSNGSKKISQAAQTSTRTTQRSQNLQTHSTRNKNRTKRTLSLPLRSKRKNYTKRAVTL